MMDRERFLESIVGFAALQLVGCGSSTEPCQELEGVGVFEVTKTDADWRALLSDAEFLILRQEATEIPYTSELLDEDRQGTYVCRGCFLPLFLSDTKYETGTGWPSFWQPIEGSLGVKPDCRLSESRTEYHCARCAGHQGHVFEDGPPPTGLRYCNNGRVLIFVPEGDPLPELRT